MKLYLIRHGQTDWNIERRIQGQQDIPLNETGRAQAACLTKAMKDKKLTAIYTSPQIRAYATARAPAGENPVPIIPLTTETGKGRQHRSCLNETGIAIKPGGTARQRWLPPEGKP